MPIETLIAAFIGLLTGAIITFFVCKIRTDSVREQMKEKISSYERELENFKKMGFPLLPTHIKKSMEKMVFSQMNGAQRLDTNIKYS